MENQICLINVIKSKMIRTDFLMKLILCIVLQGSTLYYSVDVINWEYQGMSAEHPNMMMYLLMVFSDPYTVYYSILITFSILISDIVYEEYLTANIYIKYGNRKNIYVGMLKLTAAFSFLFISIYFLMALLVGCCGKLEISFGLTKEAIKSWTKEQNFYLLRGHSIYLPDSVLQYDSLLVLGMTILKFYIGLILLSLIGLVFSIRKDSVQYGASAILLTIFLNIAVLDYYGPWNFYRYGISVDLSVLFSYLTLQRFFIYDFAGIKRDVVALFGETMMIGVIWFALLSVILYFQLRKKEF